MMPANLVQARRMLSDRNLVIIDAIYLAQCVKDWSDKGVSIKALGTDDMVTLAESIIEDGDKVLQDTPLDGRVDLHYYEEPQRFDFGMFMLFVVLPLVFLALALIGAVTIVKGLV